jgi:hypothetical protein
LSISLIRKAVVKRYFARFSPPFRPGSGWSHSKHPGHSRQSVMCHQWRAYPLPLSPAYPSPAIWSAGYRPRRSPGHGERAGRFPDYSQSFFIPAFCEVVETGTSKQSVPQSCSEFSETFRNSLRRKGSQPAPRGSEDPADPPLLRYLLAEREEGGRGFPESTRSFGLCGVKGAGHGCKEGMKWSR